MNVLVYPSTHPHATSVQQSLSSLLVPHYLPQIISPDVLAAPENPWQTACALLVLLAAPDHHTGVRQYAETGGRILALGVNATRSQGLFGLHDATSISSSVGGSLGLVDKKAALHLSFSSQAPITATVKYDEKETEVARTPSAFLDLGECARVLGRYAHDEALAGVLSDSGAIALWSCVLLHEELLVLTLSALGLRFDRSSADGPGPGLLPQLLLAHPKKWNFQSRVLRALFPNRDLELAFSTLTVGDDSETCKTAVDESIGFQDEQDTFRFHLARTFPSGKSSSDHPILDFLLETPKEGVRDVIFIPRSFTVGQESSYTPFFSPSAFFEALDEFRPSRKTDELLAGDVLLYGEVVTSTQTLLHRNPKFFRALPSPLVSLATKQVAGRGRGKNAWLSPAGSMLMSLKLSVPSSSAGSSSSASTFLSPTLTRNSSGSGSIRTSNLVFIQYLFALAVVEACQALDPANGWATKVKLKWPNDIYGEFPAGEKVELKKLGGVLVNMSFQGNTTDIVIGCGLNVLNEPPIGSLAQLGALGCGQQGGSSTLTVERVTAAVLTTFERLWNSFLVEEHKGFRPFMDRYIESWLHSGQIVTLTSTSPHTTVRILGITSDHGLLRTEPLGGGQYIDLQPDGNSFDMMKGLIKTK